jgi:hypothetical protein
LTESGSWKLVRMYGAVGILVPSALRATICTSQHEYKVIESRIVLYLDYLFVTASVTLLSFGRWSPSPNSTWLSYWAVKNDHSRYTAIQSRNPLCELRLIFNAHESRRIIVKSFHQHKNDETIRYDTRCTDHSALQRALIGDWLRYVHTTNDIQGCPFNSIKHNTTQPRI